MDVRDARDARGVNGTDSSSRGKRGCLESHSSEDALAKSRKSMKAFDGEDACLTNSEPLTPVEPPGACLMERPVCGAEVPVTKSDRLMELERRSRDMGLGTGLEGRLVFGRGNPDAEILLVGEAPGAQEAVLGRCFVGPAGRKLDALLAGIDLDSERDTYIANILKYRPPANRNPLPHEIVRHSSLLVEQLEIVRPRIVVAMGNFASKFFLSGMRPELMGKVEGVMQTHGKVYRVAGQSSRLGDLAVFVTLHPSAVLHKPSLLDVLQKDIELLRAYVEGGLPPLTPCPALDSADPTGPREAKRGALGGRVSQQKKRKQTTLAGFLTKG